MPDRDGASADLFIVDELQAMSGSTARFENFFVRSTAASTGGFWEASGITIVSSEAVPTGQIVAFDTARAELAADSYHYRAAAMDFTEAPPITLTDAQVFINGERIAGDVERVALNRFAVITNVTNDGELCDCPDCRRQRTEGIEEARAAQTRREQASKVLLREFLDEEQRAEYGRSQHFDVISEGGRRYRVGGGWVYAQDGPLAGEQFCIQMYGFPSGDADLGRKLMLETDEVKFLTTAVGAHNHKRAKWKLIRGLLMSRYRIGLLRLGRQLDDFSVACSEARRALDRLEATNIF